MIALKDANVYVGDLRTDDDSDGLYTYVWHGDVTKACCESLTTNMHSCPCRAGSHNNEVVLARRLCLIFCRLWPQRAVAGGVPREHLDAGH